MKFPKLFLIYPLIIGLELTACVGQQVSPIPMATNTVQIASTPKPTNTTQTLLTPTATMPPVYAEIDKENISQLVLLHDWSTEGLYFYESANFWFSDSKQFIVPNSDGIQALKVDDLTPTWFVKSLHSDFTINKDDQVIINLRGLNVFDKHGVETQTIRTNHFCDIDEPLSNYILTIPGTNLVITGQQDSYSDFGLNGVGYDKARVLIWDTSKNSCSELIKQFDGVLTSLSASDDGRYISYSVLIKTTDPTKSTTHVYDLNLRKEKCELTGGYDVRFTHQNQLVVYDSEGAISVVALADCTIKTKFIVGTGTETISAFAISPSGELLAGITNHVIQVWDVQTGEKLREIDQKGYIPSIIGFSPDGHFLVIAKREEGASLVEKDKVMLWGIPGN